MKARLLPLALLVGGLAGSGALAACGARTGLLVSSEPRVDGGTSETEAEPDAGYFSPDAPTPPIDSNPGPVPNACPDAGDTLVYLVTSMNGLYSFYPPTAQFTRIGRVSCPTPATQGPAWNPFSMAVDRQGRAYVLFTEGSDITPSGLLFRVSTASAACSSLPYVGGQSGFGAFGMAFVGDADGGETLHVALSTEQTDAAPKLGVLDVTTFRLAMVKNISPPGIASPELTGTGDGRLFAFYATQQGNSSAIAQLDPSTAQALANDNLSALPQTAPSGLSGWAFAFWGSDFYLFTTDPATGGSIVTRFNPADRSQVTVATLPELVVGAGVSTCAPQQ